MATVGDYVTLVRGTTYKGALVGRPGPALLGLGSIEPGGGFREGNFKTYGGACPPEMMLYPGELYVSLKGATKDGDMIGSVARVPPSVQSGRLTQDTVKLVFRQTDSGTAKYLYWLLRTPEYRSYCAGRATGSAVVGLSRSDFLSYPVPPLTPTREKIVALLEALDEKARLLRQQVTTLGDLAQALFRSWFVDFDPVRAKAEGRMPAGIDAATAALFPSSVGRHSGSELPSGWTFRTVGDLCGSLFDGPHATPPEAVEGPIFLGIRNLPGSGLDLTDVRHISEADWPEWTRRVVPQAGDIVFTYEATLGHFALLPPGLRCCLGRRTALLRPAGPSAARHFLFHWFVGAPFQEFLRSRVHPGATVDRILLSDFPSYPVLWPGDALTKCFDDVAGPLWSRTFSNATEARTMVELRDLLLPQLLSGELRVRDADRIVERAV